LGLVCGVHNLATFMCRVSRNSVSLNLLEPSVPVQACIGITILLLIGIIYIKILLENLCTSLEKTIYNI